MNTGRVKTTPVKPEGEGIQMKWDVYFVLFPLFLKHAVKFCEVKYTSGYHLICYNEAKYIDIWGNNWFSIFLFNRHLVHRVQ